MAVRNKLHRNHEAKFRDWLIANNWVIETPKGIWEVIRARHPERDRPLIVYSSCNKEHLSVDGRDIGVINAFMNSLKNN